MKRFILFGILVLFYSNFISAQENEQPTGTVSGRVISEMTQRGLPSVTIRVVGTEIGGFTNPEGKFVLENVPVGIRNISFTAIGFEKFVATDVSVGSGRPTVLEVQLAEKVIELEGVEVKGSYFQKTVEASTSTQTLNFEDIRRTPGVLEDVIRATQLLPGVNVTGGGRNDLIVRGGAPYENLFIVDGVQVNDINHFGSQGSTGGPLSIINIDFVRNVEFSAGGFGARYGDRLSSLTDIKLRNGNEESFGGKATISASQFGLNLEGPIGDGGSWLFSARRSYLDFIFNAAGFSFVPEYWDYQGKINYRLNKDNILSFVTVSAVNDVKLNNDELDNRYENSRVAVPEQYQNFSGLTWKHLFKKGFSTITFGSSYRRFTTFQNDSNLVEIFRNESLEGEFKLNASIDWKIGEKSEIAFGNQTNFGGMLEYDILIPGDYREDNTGTPRPYSVDTTFNTIKNGTFVSYSTAIGNNRITAGIRGDYYNFTIDKYFVSPRLSYSYTINENSTIIASAGRFYQSPSYIWLVGAENQELNPIRADQGVIGYSHTPREDVKIQLEAYYKKYDNYLARVWRPQAVLAPSGFDDISSDIPYGLEPLSNAAEGESYGVELFIQKKLSDIPLYGLLSLTLSESRFTSIEGEERPGTFDSRFIMNLSAGYRFGPLWEVSAKFRLATGQPTTPFNPDGSINFAEYNSGERLPVFHTLDARVDRRWNFDNFTLITYIDIQNLYNRKNVSEISFNFRTMEQELDESEIGILPSIGVSLEF
jgi:hypothetical protein